MYRNLVEILTDSFVPAVVLPKRSSPTGRTHRVFYNHLREAIDQLASQPPFSHLHPGDRVSFLIPNSFEFIVVFFAILKVRGVAAPLNPAYTPDEVEFYATDANTRCILALRGTASAETARKVGEKLKLPVWEIKLDVNDLVGSTIGSSSSNNKQRSLQNQQPTLSFFCSLVTPPWDLPSSWKVKSQQSNNYSADDIALFLHTSGTTSRPKGVPLSHANILTTLGNIGETYSLVASDISYLVMPLFHVHGLIGVLLSTLKSGGTIVVPQGFSVQNFWADFIKHSCTWYSAVPTIHMMLLNKVNEFYPGKNGKLRFIRSCSAALAPSTLFKLEKTFKAPVLEAYAMTEAAHQIASNYLPPGVRKPGSVGRGRGVDVVVVNEKGEMCNTREVGEVCIRGTNVFKGYDNNPEATLSSFIPDPTVNVVIQSSKRNLKDSVEHNTQQSFDPEFHDQHHSRFFRTGDLGYLDERNFLFLVGRVKEQINRGGFKISPNEIDHALLAIEGIVEAVAFAVPSELYGQEIECAVVLKSPKTNLTESDIKEVLSKKVAPFKVPRKVWIVDAIPKGATGKIQRRKVSEHFVKVAATEEAEKSDKTSTDFKKPLITKKVKSKL